MKVIKGVKSEHVRLLHKVFRVMIIAGKPARQVVSRNKMRWEGCFEVRKSIRLATARPFPALVGPILRPIYPRLEQKLRPGNISTTRPV